MKTKKFMMVALTMLCAMTATTLFSSCGDDKDDTPQYVMYDVSDYKKDVKISGQTIESLLVDYMIEELAGKKEHVPAVNIAYMIDYNINSVISQINKTGGIPVNVSDRDRQVIEWYDTVLTPFIGGSYKGVIDGQIKIYHSVNGNSKETIKVYSFE